MTNDEHIVTMNATSHNLCEKYYYNKKDRIR